jgi:hypothetical protein
MTRKSSLPTVLTLAALLACLIGSALAIPVAAQASEDFTLIVVPDTQYYSQSYPTIFSAQTQWIVNNRVGLNIVYVAHEGDLVQTASNTTQWDRANAAMSLLEDPVTTGLAEGIPYGVIPGNHDQPTTNYNAYFGVSRFSGRSYYGDSYDSDNDDNYTLFSASGMNFIVINLNYSTAGLSSDILDWADTLLKTYSDRRAIVVSHSILDYPPSGSSIAPFNAAGQAIYDALRDNPNLFLMLCGHNHAEGRRTDVYEGHTIYTLLADYQDLPSGGNGWLRIMTFSPADDEITVTTYSPTLNAYGEDTTMGDNTTSAPFTLAYDMEEPGPNITITGIPLSAFSSQPGTPSAEQSYTVAGSLLTEDIVITAPADFEISTNSGSGFGPSLTLPQSGGTVTATTIYARFNRATEGSSSGNITHTSSGADTRNVAVSGVAAPIPTTVSFRQGVDGYSGTVDTYIREHEADTSHDGVSFEWDGSDPNGEENFALIRFEDIFGTGAGQIPLGVTIQSATLTYYVYDVGNLADVNEVSIYWSEDVTYNGFGGDAGVQADEYGASVGSASGNTGIQSIDVTASLTTWASDPSSNHGWIFRPTGTGGVEVHSSEYVTVDQRPLLTVEYNIPTAVTLASFTAALEEGQVLVTWETAVEIDTIGFNLWRSETSDGVYHQVNDVLIPAASPGGVWGGSYTYTDSDVTPGRTYYYKLHEIETGGKNNWYGPISTEADDDPTATIFSQVTTKRPSQTPIAWSGGALSVISVGLVLRTRWLKRRR